MFDIPRDFSIIMSAETKEGDVEPKDGGESEKKPEEVSDQCVQQKEEVKETENEEKKTSEETKESSQANGTSAPITPKPPSPTKEEMKILVVGDVRGQFEAVFARVTQIMTKAGIFDLLICVGEFFAPDNLQSASEWERYQSGEAAAPLPTLVMGPCNNQTAKFYGADSGRKGCEIARSIYYLGHHGVYTTTSGVTIAYMSGLEDPAGMPNSMHSFTSADIADLNRLCQSHSKFNGVDILLTAQWPYGIMKFSDQQLPQEDSDEIKATAFQSKLVAELAVAVRPRYHFAALRNCFFERRPYRNHRILQVNHYYSELLVHNPMQPISLF